MTLIVPPEPSTGDAERAALEAYEAWYQANQMRGGTRPPFLDGWNASHAHEQAERDALTAERDELQKILEGINSRVIPGELDSIESLIAMYAERNALRDEVKRVIAKYELDMGRMENVATTLVDERDTLRARCERLEEFVKDRECKCTNHYTCFRCKSLAPDSGRSGE